MSRSEFRMNKKRKHYAYLFKDLGEYRKNILLSTKSTIRWHKKLKKNIRLSKHPNPTCNKVVYIIKKIYIDHKNSFDDKKMNWRFDINDKRIIKRIKRGEIKVG